MKKAANGSRPIGLARTFRDRNGDIRRLDPLPRPAMPNEEEESLWNFGEPEPWRRGRSAVAMISALILSGHAAAALLSLLAGEVGRCLLIAVVGCVATFLLFLVWIGQNWARWILAPFFLVFGFFFVVWGMIYGGLGSLFLSGIAALIGFSYLALSPAVYAFARRQRENISALEAVISGAVLLVVLAGVGSGLLAVHLYQASLEREAVEFAELTFHRVFVNRDPHFLEDHATGGRKYSRPQEFVNLIDEQLGEAQSVGPFGAEFRFKLDDRHLRLAATVTTRVLFAKANAWVKIQLAGTHGHWEVEHVGWED
ncbi:MAG TPA: hypothetical protein VK474_03185 [Chthoniobacterales bacterium]|nr:hypothetical protein [Chthoniobacterales bacterium]